MLPRADLNPTRPPASVEASTPAVSATDARLEVFDRLTQIAIGRELTAIVDSMLEDGTFMVKVGNSMARMALPTGTRVGDQLSMVFIAKEPRPTFLLLQQQGSAPTSLSTTARLVDHLLQLAERSGATNSLKAALPLLGSTAGMSSQELADALQKSIGTSGLFYESHLHEWISGTRTAAEVFREPQAQTQPRRSTSEPSPSDGTGIDLARLAANMKELGDGSQALMKLMRDAQLHPHSGQVDADIITQAQSPLPEVAPELARMISLQLHTLEHQSIRWQGQLWPGMPMDWEVREDKPEGREKESAQPSSWTSVVRFELPNLGSISATVHLLGNRVHVQVGTETDDAASTLRGFGNLLADALEAAGAPLDSLTVKQDESV